jgi:hypothetical protein
MPDSNSEPEKYSIDDMLDRLKNRGDGEGQLVTRADGTKALKVRKRKRRTEQTRDKLKAQNQRTQLIQIAGFVIFLVVLLVIGGILILYSNSSAFRSGLVAKIENVTGSETELKQFRMNPATASAAHLAMSWPESHALHHLEARGLRAKISPISFVGKVFQGQEVIADNGNLFLTAPGNQNQSSSQSDGSNGSPIRFNRYSVSKMNLFFSSEEKWDEMVEGMEVSYLPTKNSKGGEIRLNQGLVKMKGWPSLSLDRSYIQVRGDELDIKSMRFQMPASQDGEYRDKGSIVLSGVISPQEQGATHKLHVDLESFQISPLLGNGVGRFFHGKAIVNPDETSNTLQFTPGSGEDALLKLNLANAIDSRISISHFKFLTQLSIVLDDRWYELPAFDDEVKLSMKRSGDAVELESIHLEQRARMLIKGNMVTKDAAGNISGTLKVGLPEIIVASSKDKRLEAMFSPVKDGYRWIDIVLSGNGETPFDNFKEQYQAVNITNVPEVKAAPKPTPTPKSEGVDSFDSLIKPE